MPELEEKIEGGAGTVSEPHDAAAPAAAPAPRWRGIAPHRLNRVLACIESSLAQPIMLRELASEASMSLFHFARMFKVATGHSPHKYITLRRMERAKALLASDMPIAEVARAVGYQTQAHFTGVFARSVGTTPNVYRLRHRDRGIGHASKPDPTG